MRFKSSQGGQMIIEMILILTLLFGFTVFITSQFKQQEFFSQLVQRPWNRLAGMIETGSWKDPDRTYALHPNKPSRHRALDPTK